MGGQGEGVLRVPGEDRENLFYKGIKFIFMKGTRIINHKS